MDLELYYKPTCPFCQKVLSWLDQHRIEIPMHNTLEGDNAQKLLEIGGKQQVPCLVINGKALYESDDIINYLAGTFTS